MHIRIILLILLPLCIFSCVPIKESNSSATWIEMSSIDDEQWIYGLGEASTLESAKNAALSDIASKFHTMISSESLLYQTHINNTFNESYHSTTKSSTKNIELSNVQILRSSNTQNTVRVLLGLDRKKFSTLQLAALVDIDSQIMRLMEQFSLFSSFQRLAIGNEAGKLITKAQKKIVILRAAGVFDSSAYDIRYNTYRRRINQHSSSLRLHIRSDDGSRMFISQLNNLFTATGISISTEQDKYTQLTINTHIESSIDNKQATRLKLTAVLTTKDKSGHIVGSSQYTAFGRSYSGFDNALQIASNNLAHRLKQQGIISILGLKNND